ncbi:MAG: malate dehydrogenase [Candidatus Diapherotrites archaeon]|nr:malate dehydrogenase [Candidatus Diapherotrites archaeon]
MKGKKVSIVGVGKVGIATAFSLVCTVPNIGELVLLNRTEEKVRGEAKDLMHAAHALRKEIKVIGGIDYDLVRDSDVVVVCAGIGRGFVSSDEQLRINSNIIREISERLKEVNYNGVIVNVANPNDVMTYLFFEQTSLDRNKVLGSGNLLDTTRLHFLGYKGHVFGAHSGKLFSDNPELDETVFHRVRNEAKEIVELKKATQWGPAICISQLVNAVINDTQEIIPCSCVLDGEYGIKDVAMGVPAVIGANGVEKVIEIDLPEESKERMKASAELIRSMITEAHSYLRQPTS